MPLWIFPHNQNNLRRITADLTQKSFTPSQIYYLTCESLACSSALCSKPLPGATGFCTRLDTDSFSNYPETLPVNL